ncbi:MAG: hypothetical protein H6739_09665 [Alphaproteobacteria bacterium]|nr:hypothetical protein [Alphaproteobacteria bacterium]
MNIFLVPYTWWRHLQVAAVTGGATLSAWWLLLTFFVWVGPFWTLDYDGAIYLAVVAGTSAAISIFAEGSLRRYSPLWRLTRALLALGISGGFTFLWYWVWTFVSAPAIFGEEFADDVSDPSLVTLRFRLGAFAMAGLCTAAGPIVLRKGAGLMTQLIAGVAAGLTAAAVWHLCNYPPFEIYGDLYLASAFSALTWGLTFGLLAWGIPDELYAGWVRVLSPARFGYRIPVDAPDRSPKERFIGHFPRGLDMWLPVQDGVMELHLSIAVDDKQRYKARGLTLKPTVVRRFLERIDIRYDPRRPAPLETRLTSGDRVVMGDPDAGSATTVEFIMLPREER